MSNKASRERRLGYNRPKEGLHEDTHRERQPRGICRSRTAWYGIQTARARDNFPISGRGPDRDFIIAHARIKVAAALVNARADWLGQDLAVAIVRAASAIADGQYHEQFVVDRFQAGPVPATT